MSREQPVIHWHAGCFGYSPYLCYPSDRCKYYETEPPEGLEKWQIPKIRYSWQDRPCDPYLWYPPSFLDHIGLPVCTLL